MTIWKQAYDVVQANAFNKNTIAEPLGLLFTEIGPDYVMGTMPVDKRTHQPMGILHGGASVVLAESLGSFAAHMATSENMACVGLDINANHIRSVRSGLVTGIARPIHIGRRTHVWEIHITDEADKLVCLSRLTMAVIDTI